MKNLEKKEWQKKIRHNSWKTYVLATLTALSLSLTSCKAPTWVDVVKDKQKVEVAENQLSLLIEKRRELVLIYNQYLALSGTPWYDNLDFEKAKAQTFDQIVKYEKDINKQIKKINKYKWKLTKDELKSLDVSPNPNTPMDPNKYDFTNVH